MLKIVPFFGLKMMILIPKKAFKEKCIGIFAETGLCPNCARQGQIFPNISKRNQKLVVKIESNQLNEIKAFFDFKNPALRIRRPQVRILPGVPAITLRGMSQSCSAPFFVVIIQHLC